MKLSIVTTLYCSAPYIQEFCQRVERAAQEIAADDYEIVLVNDGSPDNSLDLAVQLYKTDPHLVVVDLSRNFGHHKAMMTGLQYARGDHVFLIDIDLEENPDWLLTFQEQISNESCDVVYGVQEQRKGGWFERWSGECFYRLFNLLTSLDLPRNVVTARLMSRRYVEALLQYREREVFLGGLWHIAGFEQHAQVVTKHHNSETTYTFIKKISILINSITSFSNAPLIGIFYVGLLISFLSCLYICFLVISWLFFTKPLSGWTSVMASIWLIGGLIISFIGVVGIYLAKIFSETKQRPYTIVRQVYARVKR